MSRPSPWPAGYRAQLRLALRRDRVTLPAWVAGILLGTAYCTSALELALPDARDLVSITAFMQGPAGVVLSGPGYGFDAPSHEIVFAGVYVLYLLLTVACMSILLVVRHTHAEEESGRLELVRAAPVSREAPSAVAVTMLAVANLAVGLLCGALLAARYDTASSLLVGAGFAAVGLVFGAVALVCAQLTEHARAASGLAFLALGVAFLLRAIGDVLGDHGSALSWLSPLAWSQQTRAYVDDRWWPLLLALGTSAGLVALARALQRRRDVGAGLVVARPGPVGAGPRLRGAFALALRLERSSLLGWTGAAAVTGLAYGALANEVHDALSDLDDPFIMLVLGGDAEQLLAGYLAVCVLLAAMLVSAYAIAAVRRLTEQELTGLAELLLAQPLARVRWVGTTALAVLTGCTLALVGAGAATGLGAAVVTGQWHLVGELTLASLAALPAVTTLAALALLGYAVRPGLETLAWVAAGYGMLVGLLGGPLQLPAWALDLSVFVHVAQVPLADPELGPLVVLTGITLAVTAAALARIRRRDLPV